jgi:hypothetical protein
MADEDKPPPIPMALADAFWDAVQAYSDWAAGVPERTFLYKRKHRSMRELCQIVDDHDDPAPNKILAVLAHETRVSPDSLQGLTYRGAGRHLTQLIEMKRDEHRRLEEIRRNR